MMRTSRTPQASHGFTMVEMLVTITIMILLAGLVVGSMAFVQDKQAREKAKAQIALLSKAIEDYKTDMGAYPGSSVALAGGGTATYGGVDASTDPEGRFSALLYDTLFYEGYDFAENGTSDPNGLSAEEIYLASLDPRENKQGWIDDPTNNNTVPRGLLIVDPWGNEYRYRVGQNAQNPDFDLWSTGKDGQTNPANTAAALNDEVNRDDIRNF